MKSSRISRLGCTGMSGGLFTIGEIKNLAFFQTRTFSKNFKNHWKLSNFEYFKGDFVIFERSLKFYRKFREDLWGNWGNFGNMHSEGFRGGDLQEARLFKKLWKNLKIWNFWENFEIYIYLNGKLIFYPFSFPTSRTFVILYSCGT